MEIWYGKESEKDISFIAKILMPYDTIEGVSAVILYNKYRHQDDIMVLNREYTIFLQLLSDKSNE